MNSLAVLLIIGSAVVGPIEAQPTVDVKRLPGGYSLSGLDDPRTEIGRAKYPPGYIERVENCKAVKGWNTFQCMARVNNNEDDIPTETLPQLCERAMREIGATPNNVYGTFGGYFSLRAGYDWQNPPIRCIPAPTGFKK